MAEFFASDFWTGFLWPLIIMVAESLLLLVVLLIAIAYILLADRKIWAAVQMRRGPNVVRSAATPASIWSMRIRCGTALKIACRNAPRESNGNFLPRASDSARMMAQSSRASPGGNPARLAICTRPSVLTKIPDFSV